MLEIHKDLQKSTTTYSRKQLNLLKNRDFKGVFTFSSVSSQPHTRLGTQQSCNYNSCENKQQNRNWSGQKQFVSPQK